MKPSMPTTLKELLTAIDSGWTEWNAALNALTADQWRSLRDENGWTVLDHVGHIARWERGAAYFLRGLPRHEGLGIEEALYLQGDDDAINAAIQLQMRSIERDELRTSAQVEHDELRRLLSQLDDATLAKPYRHFLPAEPGEGDGPLAMDVILSNTAEHYAEHLRWLRELVERAR